MNKRYIRLDGILVDLEEADRKMRKYTLTNLVKLAMANGAKSPKEIQQWIMPRETAVSTIRRAMNKIKMGA